MKTMPSEQSPMKTISNRRSTKPIMERKRRERINNSLGELKNLILDSLKKDNARHSKLEKADILEMTVRHLQNMQLKQRERRAASSLATFRSGFNECAHEVSRFLGTVDGVDSSLRHHVLNHLTDCLSGLNETCSSSRTNKVSSTSPVHVHVPTVSNPSATVSNNDFVSDIRLVPTFLPAREIAFLLPGDNLNNRLHQNLLPKYSSTDFSVMSDPVSVLGSSGILSPAASDRSESSPSPVAYSSNKTKIVPVFEPISPVPSCHLDKSKSECVWRPW
ncbi:transcription factor HES-4-B-like [Tachypleus tridentatus]|uniref:transcription factor HES-4-B-like n=1 Tax=Tachypleus tridentatus TaxID=6853 RepID=UPI003FD46FCC